MSQIVALTGASGFIGGVLATRLREKGFRVRALLRSHTHQQCLEDIGVEVIKGNLDDGQAINRMLQGCQTFIHCAGAIRGRNKQDFFPANISSISHFIKTCRTIRPHPKIILISSLAAREPSLSHYAWSKREGELTLSREAPDLPWVIFRPPAVYGPNDQSLRPLFKLMKLGIGVQLGSDNSRFSLIHVEDFVRAVIDWVKTEGPTGYIYEIDDGFPGGHSWAEVFQSGERPIRLRLRLPPTALYVAATLNEKVSRLLGYLPLLTKGKVAELLHLNWVCDTRETVRILNWQPRISLKSGLRQLETSDNV